MLELLEAGQNEGGKRAWTLAQAECGHKGVLVHLWSGPGLCWLHTQSLAIGQSVCLWGLGQGTGGEKTRIIYQQNDKSLKLLTAHSLALKIFLFP